MSHLSLSKKPSSLVVHIFWWRLSLRSFVGDSWISRETFSRLECSQFRCAIMNKRYNHKTYYHRPHSYNFQVPFLQFYIFWRCCLSWEKSKQKWFAKTEIIKANICTLQSWGSILCLNSRFVKLSLIFENVTQVS